MSLSVLVSSISRGGISRVAIAQARHLKAKLIAMCRYRPWHELLKGLDVEYLCDLRVPRMYRTVNILVAMFLKKVRERGLVIAHQLDSCVLAMRSKVRYVAYIHDLRFSPIPSNRLTTPVLRRLERRALREARIVISNSHVTREQLESEYGVDSIVIEPTVVEVPMLDERTLSLKEDMILFVCRLSELTCVVPAIEVIRKELDDVRVTVAGAWSREVRKFERRLRELRVELNVDPSDEELRDLYLRSNVVVQPFPENFGIVPLEASVHLAVPVIHFRCGVARHFDHVVSAFIFKDVSEIPEYVEEALRDHRSYAISAHRNVVERRLTVESHVERLRRVLEEVY